jgi:hypothetical protein
MDSCAFLTQTCCKSVATTTSWKWCLRRRSYSHKNCPIFGSHRTNGRNSCCWVEFMEMFTEYKCHLNLLLLLYGFLLKNKIKWKGNIYIYIFVSYSLFFFYWGKGEKSHQNFNLLEIFCHFSTGILEGRGRHIFINCLFTFQTGSRNVSSFDAKSLLGCFCLSRNTRRNCKRKIMLVLLTSRMSHCVRGS